MRKLARLSALIAFGAILAACQTGATLRSFSVGEELAYYDFNSPDEFEQGAYGAASLLIRDGVYRIDIREGDNELWWGQWGDILSDVVIDVDVNQLSQRNENAYGIMCRVRGRVGLPVDTSDLGEAPAEMTLEPDALATTVEATDEAEATEEATDEATEDADATEAAAEATEAATDDADAEATEDEATAEATETGAAADDETDDEATEEAEADATEATDEAPDEATEERRPGALLEPSNGDGYLFLIQGAGSYGIFRARGRDLTPLVDWQTSDAINVGPAENRLRAVCFDNYLAFYVNDRLVAQAIDDTYTSGQVGLAASAANRLGALIEFDNLTVSAAIAG